MNSEHQNTLLSQTHLRVIKMDVWCLCEAMFQLTHQTLMGLIERLGVTKTTGFVLRAVLSHFGNLNEADEAYLFCKFVGSFSTIEIQCAR